MVQQLERAEAKTPPSVPRRQTARLLLARIAFQNLLRRPSRTLSLILAVALGSGAIFASCIVARGIEASMEQSFARMGADLVVVPEAAMVNITSAQLTVQPTDETIDIKVIDKVASLEGVERVAQQTFFRVPIMAGMPGCKANLIAIDLSTDFTIMPWLESHFPRPMKTGDLLAGGRRSENVGEEVQPCDVPATIYGKLGRSGVGPVDDSFFCTYDTAKFFIDKGHESGAQGVPAFDRKRVSAILVQLGFGSNPEQVKFGISRLPGVKVVSGTRIVTSTRQTITALLGGMLAFTALMLIGSLILISLLFSAIISERKREIGLLRAIGTRRGDIVKMLLSEAAFTAGLGGVAGILFGSALLLAFERSLVYFLQTLHVNFACPAVPLILVCGIVCAGCAAVVGILGALIPAWRASGKEPYTLIQGEG